MVWLNVCNWATTSRTVLWAMCFRYLCGIWGCISKDISALTGVQDVASDCFVLFQHGQISYHFIYTVFSLHFINNHHIIFSPLNWPLPSWLHFMPPHSTPDCSPAVLLPSYIPPSCIQAYLSSRIISDPFCAAEAAVCRTPSEKEARLLR